MTVRPLCRLLIVTLATSVGFGTLGGSPLASAETLAGHGKVRVKGSVLSPGGSENTLHGLRGGAKTLGRKFH